MSYQDRGMKKWGGFLLSEHTEAMQNAEPTLVWKGSYDYRIYRERTS